MQWYRRFFGDFLLAANSGYVLSEFLDMWQKVKRVVVGGEISCRLSLNLVSRCSCTRGVLPGPRTQSDQIRTEW